MNYQDFGEGKRIDEQKLQELVDASAPMELREIDNFWKDFFSDQTLVGMVCADARYDMPKAHPKSLCMGTIVAPVSHRLFKKQSSGLYLVEGVNTGYFGMLFQPIPHISKRTNPLDGIVSELCLPTDKFIPLYMNTLADLGIMMPPSGF